MTKAPTVATWLRVVQPVEAEYSAIRRGIPCRPSRYWGRKVIQKPMNINQKLSLPRLSRSIQPNIFGHQ